MEVWLAPVAGTRVLVPYRISIPTPIGVGVMQATQFVSVAQPPRRRGGSEDPIAAALAAGPSAPSYPQLIHRTAELAIDSSAGGARAVLRIGRL